MAFDLFQSRRNYNEPCKWWKRDESDNYEDNKIVYKRQPNGVFWAKEVNAETYQVATVGGSFKFDRQTVQIKSPDDLSGIDHMDIVEYQGELWIVETVQKTKAKMQHTQFATDRYCSHYWYLDLRR